MMSLPTTKKKRTTIPTKVKVSSDYLHAIACANQRPDLTDSLDKHMTRELCALEKRWVSRVNLVGDRKGRSDVVELSQVIEKLPPPLSPSPSPSPSPYIYIYIGVGLGPLICE
jgi:hypothetical protein